MATINVSLPIRLKTQAEVLVENGYYASFSDLVRDSLRRLVERNKYDLWMDEAREDLKKDKAVVLGSDKEIDEYFKKV